MTNGGIFGPKLSGKTTLAKVIANNYFQRRRIRSLCLDINNEQWPQSVWRTTSEDQFWEQVWKQQRMLVIVDEASLTINRDKDLIPVFTRMRHLQHKLLVIGHSGVNLLPQMREQLDTIYLFRQPETAAKIWAETFTEKGLLAATELRQYEFITCQLYQKPKKQKLLL